jgi:hypothetical protein
VKLFLLFTISSFVVGVVLWKAEDSLRQWVLFGICLFVTMGYYFLHQI